MLNRTALALATPALALATVLGTATASAQAAPVVHQSAPAAASTSASSLSALQGDLTTEVEEGVTKSGARRMRTTATFFPAEHRVAAMTRTWNAVKLTGFTGGVQLVFLNSEGRVIGATGLHTFGVDGTWIGRSDRTDYWEEYVDGPWLSQVAEVRAVHSHAGKIRLREIVQYAVDTAKPIADLIAELYGLKPAN